MPRQLTVPRGRWLRREQLSGGQQQMVAIGRALMLNPKMPIMDEPSLGLSPLLVKEVTASIRRVADTGLPTCRSSRT